MQHHGYPRCVVRLPVPLRLSSGSSRWWVLVAKRPTSVPIAPLTGTSPERLEFLSVAVTSFRNLHQTSLINHQGPQTFF